MQESVSWQASLPGSFVGSRISGGLCMTRMTPFDPTQRQGSKRTHRQMKPHWSHCMRRGCGLPRTKALLRCLPRQPSLSRLHFWQGVLLRQHAFCESSVEAGLRTTELTSGIKLLMLLSSLLSAFCIAVAAVQNGCVLLEQVSELTVHMQEEEVVVQHYF